MTISRKISIIIMIILLITVSCNVIISASNNTTILGPNTGKVGEQYTFVVSDPGITGSNIEFFISCQESNNGVKSKGIKSPLNNIDKDDELMKTKGWSSSKSMKMTWDYPGTYIIRAKAREKVTCEYWFNNERRNNIYYRYSESGIHTIIIDDELAQGQQHNNNDNQDIEKAKIKSFSSSFARLKATIETGDNTVDCSILIDGTIWIGGQLNIRLPVQVTDTIQTPLTFGLGKVDITVTADDAIEEYKAYLVGPLFLNLQKV